MDYIDPISVLFGFFGGILASYTVADLVFAKDHTNEIDD